MSDGQRHALDSEFGGDLRGSAMKVQRGTSRRKIYDFEIAPRDAMPTGAERLHTRLLGREAGGIAFEPVCFAVGVSNFTRSEDAFEKPSAEARDGGFDALDFAEVDAGTENHCDKRSEQQPVVSRKTCFNSVHCRQSPASESPVRH